MERNQAMNGSAEDVLAWQVLDAWRLYFPLSRL